MHTLFVSVWWEPSAGIDRWQGGTLLASVVNLCKMQMLQRAKEAHIYIPVQGFTSLFQLWGTCFSVRKKGIWGSSSSHALIFPCNIDALVFAASGKNWLLIYRQLSLLQTWVLEKDLASFLTPGYTTWDNFWRSWWNISYRSSVFTCLPGSATAKVSNCFRFCFSKWNCSWKWFHNASEGTEMNHCCTHLLTNSKKFKINNCKLVEA